MNRCQVPTISLMFSLLLPRIPTLPVVTVSRRTTLKTKKAQQSLTPVPLASGSDTLERLATMSTHHAHRTLCTITRYTMILCRGTRLWCGIKKEKKDIGSRRNKGKRVITATRHTNTRLHEQLRHDKKQQRQEHKKK
ncbi:hypothetical protein B0T17DRAFT_47620 [Bombardia bombarda]|uniref:Secreted protein n=1 Tax=Bombardia bombarda TaxID=252184 RepID=A0AA39XKX6_9PEZI|nr:hypothetical protein B0T17DRAFT_47620 [Bombardia bombarda]